MKSWAGVTIDLRLPSSGEFSPISPVPTPIDSLSALAGAKRQLRHDCWGFQRRQLFTLLRHERSEPFAPICTAVLLSGRVELRAISPLAINVVADFAASCRSTAKAAVGAATTCGSLPGALAHSLRISRICGRPVERGDPAFTTASVNLVDCYC
jgi:hypothetical protein